MGRILSACGLVDLHVAWVYFLIVARALFNFGLVGLHVARVWFYFGLVALAVAQVFLNFDAGIVYVCLGWLTFG